jgi:hypothetical protein
MLFVQRSDGSLEMPDGRVLHFSIERFVTDLAKGNRCFLCGSDPNVVPFNNEHVIPQWLLRRHALHGRRITLPNDTSLRYDQYTVPCCVQCNSLLSSKLETSISALTAGGHDAVVEHVERVGSWPLFVWLALLFLKTHLKDNSLRWDRDERQNTGSIGDVYEWESLHHVHCVARTPYAEPVVEKGIIGSLLICRCIPNETPDSFDYGDLYQAKTVLLRTGDLALIAVLNDSGAARTLMQNRLRELHGALSALQLRELMTHLAVLNLHLRDRPKYFSEPFDEERMVMRASLPKEFVTEPVPQERFGALMDRSCGGIVRSSGAPDAARICELLRRGQWSFLFDANGHFTPVSTAG